MRQLAAILFTAGMACGTTSYAAEPSKADAPALTATEQEMCTLTKCQRDVRIVLHRADGSVYDQTHAVFPAIVQKSDVLVVPGQTVHFEADVVGNELVKLVAVDAVKMPEKTITATFEQKDGHMILTVRNPFPKPLKFNMAMMRLASERLEKTSSCPVGPGRALFESWPYPIFQLLLANARLLEPGDKSDCVY